MSVYYIKPNIFYIFKKTNIIKINDLCDQSLNLIIVDNFYKNPYEIRNFALQQDFILTGNYPGVRTLATFGNNEIYNYLTKYLLQHGLKIVEFEMYGMNYGGNCAFTLNTANDISKKWIHIDDDDLNDNSNENYISMAGVIYLTPDAPLDGGTIFYEFDYNRYNNPVLPLSKYSFDKTKWKKINIIGNVFNRLIIFNANIYHSFDNQFGIDKYSGRLTQNLFFLCERIL